MLTTNLWKFFILDLFILFRITGKPEVSCEIESLLLYLVWSQHFIKYIWAATACLLTTPVISSARPHSLCTNLGLSQSTQWCKSNRFDYEGRWRLDEDWKVGWDSGMEPAELLRWWRVSQGAVAESWIHCGGRAGWNRVALAGRDRGSDPKAKSDYNWTQVKNTRK